MQGPGEGILLSIKIDTFISPDLRLQIYSAKIQIRKRMMLLLLNLVYKFVCVNTLGMNCPWRVSFHAIKAATANPVESLRYE